MRITALFFAFTACAHLSPSKVPPSVGFYGRQCVRTREVVCMLDSDFTLAQCVHHVPQMVAAVNEAAAQPLFHYSVAVPFSKEALASFLRSGAYVVFGSRDLPPGVGAVTFPQAADSKRSDCITSVYTVVNALTWKLPADVQQAVILHEALHALGAGHAQPGTAFRSVMTPAVKQPGWTAHISIFDRAALRAAY